ncbi:cytochrome P450 [Xylariomycetidae sp. FL0641]|nr:cytochrome P450 [Xylariomycetidae sp. FL0641]
MFAQILVAAVAIFIPYICTVVRYKRLKQFARFPQLPPSAIWGHLRTLDEYVQRAPPKAHADVAIASMHKDLGRPPVMLVDLRPVSPPLLVIGSYEVAEQISKASSRFPYSPPKAPETWEHLEHITGPTSIASSQGEEWKALRKRFNPGFAPQHLLSLLPAILDIASLFLEHLETLADSGQEFSLQELATNLTFDVIGRVVLDIDMGAQDAHPTEFMRAFHALIQTYADEQITLPWWCTPLLELRRTRLSRRVRATLRALVRERHAELAPASTSASASASASRNHCILAMSLRGVDAPLTAAAVDETVDQVSTFLFAGHDTTSTTIAWAVYELARTPRALRAVRAELDGVFGGPDGLAPDLVLRTPYTGAVIREVLRLWPPGGTSRAGAGLRVRLPGGDGEEMDLDGLMLYPPHRLVQRDPGVFGASADAFVPERWLGPETIPAGAWRAFERGPRACIGQELALLETRVVLALALRRFDFVKVGIGAVARGGGGGGGEPELGSHGQFKVVEEMYMKMQVTSKPVDGMMMKVKLAT